MIQMRVRRRGLANVGVVVRPGQVVVGLGEREFEVPGIGRISWFEFRLAGPQRNADRLEPCRFSAEARSVSPLRTGVFIILVSVPRWRATRDLSSILHGNGHRSIYGLGMRVSDIQAGDQEKSQD
jgi:hypothetical protein